MAASGTGAAQATKAQLEVSETFFTLAAGLNSCGYDAGLDASMRLRQAVRADVQAALQKSPSVLQARNAICQFWIEHQRPGSGFIAAKVLPDSGPALHLAEIPGAISGAGAAIPRCHLARADRDRSLFKGAVQ